MLNIEMKVKEFGEYWLQNVAKKQMSTPTFEAYQSRWNCQIAPNIDDTLTIEGLEAYHIQNVIDRMQSEGAASNYIYSVFDTMNAMFRYMNDLGLRRDNVLSQVTLPERVKYEAVICDDAEINRINRIAKNTALEIPILLASKLGLRRSQVLALLWKDCDFVNHTLKIDKSVINSKHHRYGIGKEAKSRIVTIPKEVEQQLVEWKTVQKKQLLQHGKMQTQFTPICTTITTKVMERTYLNKLFRKFVTENQLTPQLRFHDLRWSYINNELRRRSLKDVAESVGHSSCIYTIDYYVKREVA